jgi:biofilm PGA synthesis N-glycosyltransferase PgaC
MRILFWASMLLLAYVYAGYPLLLALWSAVAARPVAKRTCWSKDAGPWPSVSVIVAAHNEGPRLSKRISNLLDQKYPGPLEILVGSDGSTDNTRAVLAQYDDRVRLLELPRGGKPMALNASVAAATGEIIVFADARQRWARDAILELVSNFHDPDVGGVTGQLILQSELAPDQFESTIDEAVGLYWKYEKWLRRHESRVRSTIGTTGAIYALRRSLWQPLPETTLLDDVLAPMRVVLAGWRIVFDETAHAFDRAAPNSAAETKRKTRTLAGNYQILALEPRLLLPFVNPVWIQYASHKLGRLVAPWALIAAFVTSAFLAAEGWPYAVALVVQIGFYGLAALGGWIESGDRIAAISVPEPAPAVSPPVGTPGRVVPQAPDGRHVKAG